MSCPGYDQFSLIFVSDGWSVSTHLAPFEHVWTFSILLSSRSIYNCCSCQLPRHSHPWPSNLETWFGHASLVGCKQLLKRTRCVGFPSGWMRPSDQTQVMVHGKTNRQGEMMLQTGFGMSFQAGWTRTMTRQPSFLWVSDSWLWRGQHPYWSLLIGSDLTLSPLRCSCSPQTMCAAHRETQSQAHFLLPVDSNQWQHHFNLHSTN